MISPKEKSEKKSTTKCERSGVGFVKTVVVIKKIDDWLAIGSIIPDLITEDNDKRLTRKGFRETISSNRLFV